MIWQDYVVAIGCFLLGAALIPSMTSKDKPARSSCLLSAIILAIFTGVFATLHLWVSVAAESLVTIAWTILLFQRREPHV